MKREHAKLINNIMLEYGAKLDASVKLVMDNGSSEEFKSYRRAVGNIMGIMLIEIMNPIYQEYPDLTPEGLLLSLKSGKHPQR